MKMVHIKKCRDSEDCVHLWSSGRKIVANITYPKSMADAANYLQLDYNELIRSVSNFRRTGQRTYEVTSTVPCAATVEKQFLQRLYGIDDEFLTSLIAAAREHKECPIYIAEDTTYAQNHVRLAARLLGESVARGVWRGDLISLAKDVRRFNKTTYVIYDSFDTTDISCLKYYVRNGGPWKPVLVLSPPVDTPVVISTEVAHMIRTFTGESYRAITLDESLPPSHNYIASRLKYHWRDSLSKASAVIKLFNCLDELLGIGDNWKVISVEHPLWRALSDESIGGAVWKSNYLDFIDLSRVFHVDYSVKLEYRPDILHNEIHFRFLIRSGERHLYNGMV